VTLPDLDAARPLPPAPWFEPGAHWSARQVLLHVIAETAQHAGHADIIRELIDGKGGPDQDAIDEQTWRVYVAQVQTAANTFATGPEVQQRP